MLNIPIMFISAIMTCGFFLGVLRIVKSVLENPPTAPNTVVVSKHAPSIEIDSLALHASYSITVW